MDDLTQKAIRTYKGDVEQAVQENKTTVAQVVAAQESGRRNTDNQTTFSESGSSIAKKLIVAIISLFFIAAGSAGGYYLYLQSPLAKITTSTTPVSATFPSIIDNVFQKQITISKPSEIIPKMGEELLITGGSLTELVMVTTGTGGLKTKIPVESILPFIARRAPQTLTRSITGNYMIGVYRGYTTAPFVILKNNFFQNALSGMFVWESKMPDDIKALFQSASTTELVLFDPEHKFTDGLVDNHDVRILPDEEGRQRLLYAFSDNETIIITTTQEALGHLLGILDKQAFIRRK